jgi:hydroxymethylglutaryl-CoA lyase
MPLPKSVKIVEVGPRDGLQNESQTIPTTTKIKFINLLSETGLSVIEATSFVSPKKIPQLADHTEVLQHITKNPQVHYPVLVPNLQGLNNAIAAGAKEISVFIAASETFSQKNINCSIEESLNRIVEMLPLIKQHQLTMRGYISCVLGCPYEGEIDYNVTLKLAEKLLTLGCYEISLGDTIGVGTPLKAQTLIKTLLTKIPAEKLAMHFHDTYGQAIANIYASLELGISTFDSSIAGLGGCPYAKGATGNVATEDVIYLMHGLNIHTGVDLNKLVQVAKFISDQLGKSIGSKVTKAMLNS